MTTPGPPAIVQTGRRLLARYRLDRCVVLVATSARDASGGTVTTYTPRNGGVPTPCTWGRPTDDEARIVGGTVQGKAPMALSLPVGDPVTEGDRVRNEANGKLHVVVANLTPASVMATQHRVIVREL